MKKLLVTAIALVAAASVYAQGTLVFANYFGTTRASVTSAPETGAVLCTGPGYLADLYIAPAGTTDPLSPLFKSAGLAELFKTGTGAGYFLGGVKTLAGQPAGMVAVQVRAWNAAAGATYAAALLSPIGEIGMSNVIPLELVVPPTPAKNLVGIQGFQLHMVPEPGSFALAALGLASLVIFRRRR
jgi:hypothetical protein